MGLPNLLTIFRIMIAPFFGYLLYEERYVAAVILFLIAGLTDILDGFIARKFNMITSFGKIADPIADKMMVIIGLGVLTAQGLIPFYIVGIILAKELIMGIGGLYIYTNKKLVVSASWYGKLSTVVFYIAIILVVFDIPYSDIFILVALFSALFAFFMYIREYLSVSRDSS